MRLLQLENTEKLEMIAVAIAHEVKSPLSLVQANIDLLRLEDIEGRHSKRYDLISREILKANALVIEFLDLVKLAYDLDEAVEIYDVLMDCVASYEGVDTVSISIECQNKNLYVKGNRKLLSWVVSNIVKNSIESFQKDGSIKIFVYEGSDGFIILEFLDNGGGISKEKLEEINHESPIVDKTKGSGVGISICKNIINEHNGTYDIRNVNGGCLVRLSLPVCV